MEALQKALDDAVEKGTFSLKAIEAIKALREENVRTFNELDRAHAAMKDRGTKLDSCRERIEKLESSETVLTVRLKNIDDREKVMTKLECEVEKHKAVTGAVMGCFEQVFKNPVVQTEHIKRFPQTIFDSKGEPHRVDDGHTKIETTNP